MSKPITMRGLREQCTQLSPLQMDNLLRGPLQWSEERLASVTEVDERTVSMALLADFLMFERALTFEEIVRILHFFTPEISGTVCIKIADGHTVGIPERELWFNVKNGAATGKEPSYVRCLTVNIHQLVSRRLQSLSLRS